MRLKTNDCYQHKKGWAWKRTTVINTEEEDEQRLLCKVWNGFLTLLCVNTFGFLFNKSRNAFISLDYPTLHPGTFGWLFNKSKNAFISLDYPHPTPWHNVSYLTLSVYNNGANFALAWMKSFPAKRLLGLTLLSSLWGRKSMARLVKTGQLSFWTDYFQLRDKDSYLWKRQITTPHSVYRW